jgi:hypothetical protein
MTGSRTPGRSATVKPLMLRLCLLLCVAVLGPLLMPSSGSAAEIDGCKYLVVADQANDTAALARTLREQGAKRGFTVVASGADLPADESFGVCTVVGSWLGSLETGSLSVSVINDADGTPVAAAEVKASNVLGFEHMLRTAVEKAYSAFGYTGFSAEAFRARLDRLYPSRPTYEVSKAWLAEWKPRPPIEGVWTDPDGLYRLAILPSPKGLRGTHIGVVLESASPLWRAGEIKIEFTGEAAATSDPIAATFYLLNKQPLATTFTVTAERELEATLTTPAGRQVFRLRRVADQGR